MSSGTNALTQLGGSDRCHVNTANSGFNTDAPPSNRSGDDRGFVRYWVNHDVRAAVGGSRSSSFTAGPNPPTQHWFVYERSQSPPKCADLREQSEAYR